MNMADFDMDEGCSESINAFGGINAASKETFLCTT